MAPPISLATRKVAIRSNKLKAKRPIFVRWHLSLEGCPFLQRDTTCVKLASARRLTSITRIGETLFQRIQSRVIGIQPVQFVPGGLSGGEVVCAMEICDDKVKQGGLVIGIELE